VASQNWNGTSTDLIVYKYDKNGNQVGNPYVFDNGGFESVSYICIDSSGNIIISGTTDPAGTWDATKLYIVKLAPDLSKVWHAVYDPGCDSFGGYLTFDAAGNICLHGDAADSPDLSLESYAVTYNPLGQQLSVGHSRLDIRYSGIWYGCWESGRDYMYRIVNSGTVTEENYCYGYADNTGTALVRFGDVSGDYFPESYGKLLVHVFVDPEEYFDVGYYCMFDNGAYGEAVGDIQVTKACNLPGDASIYWFLWGDDAYEGYDNVVIQKTVSGQWFAHSFMPNYENFEALLSGWSLIGEIQNPETLLLPELGDWWQYCDDNGIVPEFPALSSQCYDDDSDGRMDRRVDHNDFMDTTYLFYWNSPATGEVRVDMYYDYNEDGNQDFIGEAVYSNSSDYDVSNMETWTVVQSFQKTSYDLFADFGLNGFWKYSNNSWTSLSGWNADSFILSLKYSGSSYDALVDFGSNGFWKYSNNTWTRLTTLNADSFLPSEPDGGSYDVLFDFGSNGFWKYSSGAWTRLTALDAESYLLSGLTGAGYDTIADFGSSGLWKYSGTAWTMLTSLNADSFMLSDVYNGQYDTLIDFGSNGFWKYSGSAWTRLTGLNAESYALSDLYSGSYDIVFDFGQDGFWKYSGSAWTKLTDLNAESYLLSGLINGSYDTIADFGSNGFWKYSNNAWTRLTTLNAESFMTSEVHNGQYDTIADFGSNGLWKYSNNAWTQLTGWNAGFFVVNESNSSGKYDIIADFATHGLWKYSNSTWTQLTGWDPDPEISQRMDIQSRIGVYGRTAPGGFTTTTALAGGPTDPNNP
jgi:hypothetical protein